MNVNEIPQDVIESVLAIGEVEYGTTIEQSDEAHAAEHAETLRLTREHFGTVGDVAMKSVYLKDTNVVLAHTGTSPNAEQHARILSGLWNWLVENAQKPPAANDNEKRYTVGERTHQQVFEANGITDMSDLQALLDATERALSARGDFASQINAMVDHFHGKSKAAGWWEENGEDLTTNKYVHATKLMLCVSELSEAMEGLRKGLMDDKLTHRKMAEVELADAVIRIFDLAGVLGYDLGGAVVEKSAYNTVRADHQPGNRTLAGGKAY